MNNKSLREIQNLIHNSHLTEFENLFTKILRLINNKLVFQINFHKINEKNIKKIKCNFRIESIHFAANIIVPSENTELSKKIMFLKIIENEISEIFDELKMFVDSNQDEFFVDKNHDFFKN